MLENQLLPAILPRQLIQELIDEGLPVLNSYISSSVAVKQSHEVNQPLVYCNPKHKLTAEYSALYNELTPVRKNKVENLIINNVAMMQQNKEAVRI